MKKLILMLIITAVCATSFACSDVKDEKTNAVPDSNQSSLDEIKNDDYYFSDLSDERYDGYNYRILVRKSASATQYFDEPQADVVDNAIYERNKFVENKYGITISISESSNPEYETDALNSILAGDDAYDIIFPHARAAFTYAIQGACVNYHDISTIHLDKPWWAADIVDSCTINGKLYVLDGDISTSGLSATHCLFFNKRIFDELGYDYPYEMVKNGEWTFDEFSYLVRKGSADLNGDGLYDTENDRYGFASNKWSSPIVLPYTGGQRIYNKNDSGELYISLYSNKTVDMYVDFFGLMTGNSAAFADTYSTMFQSGRLMFVDGGLGNAKKYRSMEDEFGIIPYPKYSSDDEYATITNGVAPLMIIPITVSDTERTGAITEALCAYGSKNVIPAFYEVNLKTKYARDDESEEMMDLIKSSRVFDLGYLAGGEFSSTGYHLANMESNDFASFYAARKDKAQVSLDNFVKNYGGN